jgi:hypothetical protein
MRFAVTMENETLDALAVRVYAFEGKPTQATQRAAAKALTDANPFLRRLDEVPPGTVVAIPDLDQARPTDEARDPEAMIAGLVADQLRGAVALTQRMLSDDVEAELGETRESIKLLRSAEARQLGRENAWLKDQIPRITEAANTRMEAARELERYQQQAFAQLDKDLEGLLKTFGAS